MLNSLYIANYRNLKSLQIPALNQLNLIVGKNNTGKSSLLEAVSIYVTKADVTHLFDLLTDRDENFAVAIANIEANMRSLSALFSDRKMVFELDEAIQIGESKESPNANLLSLRFVRYRQEEGSDKFGNYVRNILIDDNQQFPDEKIGLEITYKDSHVIRNLDTKIRNSGIQLTSKLPNLQYIKTNYLHNINANLWDNIALTDKEQDVINALRIIEPQVERLAFIGERERVAYIKLTHQHAPIPLKSMGDGLNRVLTIILALVNADNGYLLIDEFENGLHYSVQETLWKMIFMVANKLNVQVFATTH
ncbi:MAG TPA: AAA family ATPase, partial [Chitinophagales bacterium]|nr:AAA family ATPase [Chitinophagales bacterium]